MRNRTTIEKQLRETKKKQKAAAKRAGRRRQRQEPSGRSDSENGSYDKSAGDGEAA
jgi:hypothetical protein